MGNPYGRCLRQEQVSNQRWGLEVPLTYIFSADAQIYGLGQVLWGMLQLNIRFAINEAIFAVPYYESLKDFYDKRVAKENEKVILKKIKTQP